jgi:hypothetical protein
MRKARQIAGLLFCLTAGCSTAPVADVLDFFKPSRLGSERTPPYGGVCAPTPGGSPLSVTPPAGSPLPPPPAPAGLAPPPLPVQPTKAVNDVPMSLPSLGAAPDVGGPR